MKREAWEMVGVLYRLGDAAAISEVREALQEARGAALIEEALAPADLGVYVRDGAEGWVFVGLPAMEVIGGWGRGELGQPQPAAPKWDSPDKNRLSVR